MVDPFSARSRTLAELLGSSQEARVVVPRFQRGYSWEKKHVGAFWDDLIRYRKEHTQPDGPAKYFLGPIVTMSADSSVVQLLDGQQRLATATILFCVIRDTANKSSIAAGKTFASSIQAAVVEKEDTGFALELGDTDRVYFAATIQSSPPTQLAASVRSHRRIKDARAQLAGLLQKHLSSLSPAKSLDELKGIYKTLRHEMVMAAIPVGSERDAFRIFETLNDRGLRLSVPDLLLNYLMREADEPNRKSIRDSWTRMIERMGRRDINRFLRHLWVSKYGDLKSEDLFTALKTHIEDQGLRSLDFAMDCSAECDKYVELIEASHEAVRNADVFVKSLVHDLDIKACIPLLLSCYNCYPDILEEVAKWLLVFVVRYQIVAELKESGLEDVLFELARGVRKSKSDAKTSGSCRAEIKKTLVKNAPTDETLIAAMKSLCLSPDDAEYLVRKLAHKMQSKTKETGPVIVSLEHVFPKNPSDEWKDPSELEPLLWHIGNLTMLGNKLNEGVGNAGFQKKKDVFKKSEVTMTQDIAKHYTAWGKAEIEKRAEMLTKHVLSTWDFDNPSWV